MKRIRLFWFAVVSMLMCGQQLSAQTGIPAYFDMTDRTREFPWSQVGAVGAGGGNFSVEPGTTIAFMHFRAGRCSEPQPLGMVAGFLYNNAVEQGHQMRLPEEYQDHVDIVILGRTVEPGLCDGAGQIKRVLGLQISSSAPSGAFSLALGGTSYSFRVN